jgi:hypothetical protein
VRQPALAPLFDILAMHRAAPKCQFDAFAEYVAAAEEQGVKGYPFRRSIAQPLDVNAAKLSPVCSARKRRPRQSGAPYASRFGRRRFVHASVMFWFFSGNDRMRLPVAAKIALSTAGAATKIVGSPTPPQNPPDGMIMHSTFGISLMRIEL